VDFSSLITFDLLPWQWAAWIGYGICIGLLKAGFYGISAAMLPVIALIFGEREATGINLPLLCFADLLAVLYYRRHTEWKYILKLLPWSLAGFGAAVFVDHLVPVQSFRYLMGGCIIAGLIVMIFNERLGKDKLPVSAWWFSAAFGIAGGFSTMIGNIGGPILSVFLLSVRLPKNSFVGTTSWYFLIINYLKLPIQIFIWKNITVKTILFDVTLLPVVLAGGIIGVFLIKKISDPIYRKVIILLTMISTVLLFL
jgi:uncharacterized membrane protein YfcA